MPLYIYICVLSVYSCRPATVAHYDDVIMGAIASLITSLTIVYSTVYSDADERKHQSSASLAFVWGIHRELVNSPHKWPVTRKMFPFDDVIMMRRARGYEMYTGIGRYNHKRKLIASVSYTILQFTIVKLLISVRQLGMLVAWPHLRGTGHSYGTMNVTEIQNSPLKQN